MAGQAARKKSINEDLREIEKLDDVIGADPMKLWEGYLEQSLMWRALTLLALPTTILSICLAVFTFLMADTRIEIPAAPEPGFYKLEDIPDKMFIGRAKRVLSMIASYQPDTAENQFKDVRKFLWQPALSKFQLEYLNKELGIIKDTARSQMFYVSNDKTEIHRFDEYVEVKMLGRRKKLLREQLSKMDQVEWTIRMTTVPPNVHNFYGIVVHSLNMKVIDRTRKKKKGIFG